jgi:hypothetical protein
MALNLGRIQQFLSVEDPWRGALGSSAPLWARVAIETGLKVPKRVDRWKFIRQRHTPMVPQLDGKFATIGFTDWQILALWVCFRGSKLRAGEEGQQLVAEIESGWVDFKRWLWDRFGL